jgi:hypothetical protein
MIINPYYPDNLIFSYQHMLPKLADATSVRVGNEWYPYDTKQLLDNSLPALIAFASGALALGLSGRKMDARTALGLFVSLLFGLMLFQARRFVEYFPPFALIFAAFAWAPLLMNYQDPSVKLIDLPYSQSMSTRRLVLSGLILGLTIFASIVKSVPAAQDAIGRSKSYGLYANASAWLEKNTPANARVFQTDWDDFPRLFYYNAITLISSLDPTYMQLYNANLYDLWVKITQGHVENPSQVIATKFDSRYIHTDLNHRDFLQIAAKDPGLKEVYRDDQAVIFEVVSR